jgi:hypothetical protein
MIASASAQNITRIEYFFNTDPGFGQATPLNGFTSSADVANFQTSINLSSVSIGVNNLYVRAEDANGKWSITNKIPFVKVDVSTSDIVRAEYFFNTDPGFGQATALTGFTSSANVANFQTSINLSSVSDGVNNLYVRAEDANGSWSITNVIPFIKVDVSTSDIVRAEYFFNTDPGFGQATPFTLPVSKNISKQALTIDIESAPPGINTLYVRTEDSNGSWSLTNWLTFIKGTVAGNISALEYFIDTDPGFGMATPVDLVPAEDISSYNFNADVSSVTVNTTHNLFIRAKDINGVWSLTNILSFTRTPGVGMDEITDASAEFTVFPNPATDKIILQCSPDKEMDKIELIDIQGKLMPVQSSGNSTEKQIDISMLTKGIYFIKITSGKDVVYKKIVKD